MNSLSHSTHIQHYLNWVKNAEIVAMVNQVRAAHESGSITVAEENWRVSEIYKVHRGNRWRRWEFR